MTIMVAYNESPAADNALALACEKAARSGEQVIVVTSMEGGRAERLEEIQQVSDSLKKVEAYLEAHKVPGEALQLVRGLSPGEDIVKFAEENAVDRIFLGIEKISRTSKIFLGSTAQYVILHGPCPVTTTK